jgi:mono/diheme cytochrome c family protein
VATMLRHKMRCLWMLSWTLTAPASASEETGKAVWEQSCRGCHGADGKAQTRIGQTQKIPDFTATAWQSAFADQDIRGVIQMGSASNPKMKAYEGRLSAEQIDAVVRYIRTLK